MSSYDYQKLDALSKSRYLLKLKTCGLKDCPYLLPADSWLNDPTKWPTLELPEVYDYLINTPGVFTREKMKNSKSLEAHNQFRNGWVQTVFHIDVPQNPTVVLKSGVMPSQRLNETPHTPWIAISRNDDTVIAAHCTCMAGLGESCSHIGALLFKIEAAVRAGFTARACTDEACQWNNDFVSEIQGAPVSQTKFSVQETGLPGPYSPVGSTILQERKKFFK